MTTEEGSRSRTEQERTILDRADKIDNLISAFIAELKVHVDLLRDEIDTRERPR